MAKKFDNISNNNVRVGGNGLSGLFSSSAPAKEEAPSVQAALVSAPISLTTRQTFVILAEDLQYIKDIVRAKRMEGEIEFTQKEALHHIIEFHRNNQVGEGK
jgi:hypothetical protein